MTWVTSLDAGSAGSRPADHAASRRFGHPATARAEIDARPCPEQDLRRRKWSPEMGKQIRRLLSRLVSHSGHAEFCPPGAMPPPGQSPGNGQKRGTHISAGHIPRCRLGVKPGHVRPGTFVPNPTAHLAGVVEGTYTVRTTGHHRRARARAAIAAASLIATACRSQRLAAGGRRPRCCSAVIAHRILGTAAAHGTPATAVDHQSAWHVGRRRDVDGQSASSVLKAHPVSFTATATLPDGAPDASTARHVCK